MSIESPMNDSDIGFTRFIGGGLEAAVVAMLEQTQDCVKLIDRDGTLAFMNANGRKAMAMDGTAPVSGIAWPMLWPGESRPQIEAALAAALRGERSRFKAFCPTVRGEPRWWDVSVSPIRGADGAVGHVLATSRDITPFIDALDDERDKRLEAERNSEIQTLVADETRHRLKNVLAIVGSISNVLVRRSGTLAEYRQRFARHLQSLANAQDLLGARGGARGDLGSFVADALGAGGNDPRVVLGAMPDDPISDQSAQVMALVLGELHTNAVKHGALGTAGGRVTLDAACAGGTARFTWAEDHGHPVAPVEIAGGAGSELMRGMLATDDGAPVFDWGPRGLTVRFAVPLV
ncbi:PAS domain S-box protein [Palleronia sediminis]|uniref:histidine kinase n=1 Tax=Palleronia sediminis TaxID=2547833 RepID=A0A4R6A0S8_9RHOB|nr:PAS domain-containing protein [Palleronia sediminis]TDL75987.1 PAS domain S-box protein [Palleronia sediminis]